VARETQKRKKRTLRSGRRVASVWLSGRRGVFITPFPTSIYQFRGGFVWKSGVFRRAPGSSVCPYLLRTNNVTDDQRKGWCGAIIAETSKRGKGRNVEIGCRPGVRVWTTPSWSPPDRRRDVRNRRLSLTPVSPLISGIPPSSLPRRLAAKLRYSPIVPANRHVDFHRLRGRLR
jgi:hypothetical protein